MQKEKPINDLQILDKKIGYAKREVYSKGIILLPGISALTYGALVDNTYILMIGGLGTLGSLVYKGVYKKEGSKMVDKNTKKI